MRQLYQQLWGLAANTVVICTRNQEVDRKELPGDILPALGAQDPPTSQLPGPALASAELTALNRPR